MNSVALPEEFVQRLQYIVPDDQWQAVFSSFSEKKPTVLRINTILADPDKLIRKLRAEGFDVQPVTWKPDAILVPHEQRRGILDSHWYKKGQLYSQGLSSQLAPLLLEPKPGEEILDLCAAPGGKTLQMACMMKDSGRIAAVEKSKTRFFKLKANLKHQQVSCVDLYLTDGAGVWRKTPERFDRVLLDAPCSTEARFKANKPKTFEHWKLKKIKEMANKQKALIRSAIKCLKPGGILVYSTCSFAAEENEAIIHHALKHFQDAIQVEPFSLAIENTQAGLLSWQGKEFNPQVQRAVRILPNE
ncbi:MAG: RsmB/NOP family class I SAM-dependent RNA methyltransferase, partial [Gammaproteobacteria bacterium]|nr:RsmB/NOP family class I SAM-dependent RNA methyltransferase [Gammaproteobacteria bacterium]